MQVALAPLLSALETITALSIVKIPSACIFIALQSGTSPSLPTIHEVVRPIGCFPLIVSLAKT
jgi:hypothetical protein